MTRIISATFQVLALGVHSSSWVDQLPELTTVRSTESPQVPFSTSAALSSLSLATTALHAAGPVSLPNEVFRITSSLPPTAPTTSLLATTVRTTTSSSTTAVTSPSSPHSILATTLPPQAGLITRTKTSSSPAKPDPGSRTGSARLDNGTDTAETLEEELDSLPLVAPTWFPIHGIFHRAGKVTSFTTPHPFAPLTTVPPAVSREIASTTAYLATQPPTTYVPLWVVPVLPSRLPASTNGVVDGIEASVLFQVAPNEADAFASAGAALYLQAAIATMLGVPESRVTVLRIVVSENVLARQPQSKTGALQVEYVVLCPKDIERRELAVRAQTVGQRPAEKLRFASTLAASLASFGISDVNAESVRGALLDRGWSSALARGAGDVLQPEAVDAPRAKAVSSVPERVVWYSLVALIFAALLGALGLVAYLTRKRAPRRTRGLNFDSSEDLPEDLEVGQAPTGVGFDPRRFDPRRYMRQCGGPDLAVSSPAGSPTALDATKPLIRGSPSVRLHHVVMTPGHVQVVNLEPQLPLMWQQRNQVPPHVPGIVLSRAWP